MTEGSTERARALARLAELFDAARADLALRDDLLAFWDRRQHRERRAQPAAPVTSHRGATKANRTSTVPCLCGQPLQLGQLIVKRWNQWIHDACYDSLQAAKDAR